MYVDGCKIVPNRYDIVKHDGTKRSKLNAICANSYKIIFSTDTKLGLPTFDVFDEEVLIPFPDESICRDGKEIRVWQDGWLKGYKSNISKWTDDDIIAAVFKGFDLCLDNMKRDSSEITNDNITSFMLTLAKRKLIKSIEIETENWRKNGDGGKAFKTELPRPKLNSLGQITIKNVSYEI